MNRLVHLVLVWRRRVARRLMHAVLRRLRRMRVRGGIVLLEERGGIRERFGRVESRLGLGGDMVLG